MPLLDQFQSLAIIVHFYSVFIMMLNCTDCRVAEHEKMISISPRAFKIASFRVDPSYLFVVHELRYSLTFNGRFVEAVGDV